MFFNIPDVSLIGANEVNEKMKIEGNNKANKTKIKVLKNGANDKTAEKFKIKSSKKQAVLNLTEISNADIIRIRQNWLNDLQATKAIQTANDRRQFYSNNYQL